MTYAECFNILLEGAQISKLELARELGITGTAIYKKFRLNQFSSEDINTILRLCNAQLSISSSDTSYLIDNL